MIRKKDLYLIVALLLVAAVGYGVMMLTRTGQTLSGAVEIYAGGELYATARLDAPQDIRVAQADGAVNVITIAQGGVHMSFSSCKNQLCLHQGELTADNWTRRAMGRSIVCLPNSVLVELALDDGHPSLEMEDLPDI